MVKVKKSKAKIKEKPAVKAKEAGRKSTKPTKPAAKPVVRVVRQKSTKLALPKPKVILKKKEIPIPKPHPIKETIPKEETISKVLPTEAPAAVAPAPKIKPAPKVTPVKVIPKEVVKEVKVVPPPVVKVELKEIELKLPVTLKDLAVKLQEKPSVLIKALMGMGVMAGINQLLEERVLEKLSEKFGFKVKKAASEEEEALHLHQEIDRPETLKARPPVVTFMGHVDHGKTSLLDAIRKTKVVESEHGGITQHIGAYRVVLPQGAITFLDTPGHEAFTAMRARGASITDIVVLVVAADDGVMPQTKEAIDHARAAGVPIIVALNKIDKPQANIELVKKQLSESDLTAEDWGGKTITVPVSAKTGQGIDGLLEMILLEAQMLELKANPHKLARGVVIEAKVTKGRGPVSTLLVQNGTLHLNENVLVGKYSGKVRAMFNHLAQPVVEASPAHPVEVLGISGVPPAGELFFVIPDEKKARELALLRQEKEKQQQVKAVKRISLEELHSQIQAGKIKELKLIVKADVQGSLGAIKDTLNKLNISEIKLDIIHEGVGSINASDAILAVASNALILGFNVTVDELAKEWVAKEGLDARTYNIIYELANDIKQAIEGMLEPKLKKVFLGKAEVRKVFKLSRAGTVAGCFVTKGKITRTGLLNLVRNGEVVFEGKISSLKRFKDDVKEVLEGFECGIALAGFQDTKEGDIIEAYDIEKIARKL